MAEPKPYKSKEPDPIKLYRTILLAMLLILVVAVVVIFRRYYSKDSKPLIKDEPVSAVVTEWQVV